jgi:hypothetical protein
MRSLVARNSESQGLRDYSRLIHNRAAVYNHRLIDEPVGLCTAFSGTLVSLGPSVSHLVILLLSVASPELHHVLVQFG